MSIPKQVREAAEHAQQMMGNSNPPPVVEQKTVEPAKPATQQVAPVEDWKRRFTGYKSATDKTIYDLRQEVRELEQLKVTTEQLKAQLETLQGQAPAVDSEALELFSEDEIKTFDKLMESKTSDMHSELETLKAEREANRIAGEKAAAKAIHDGMLQSLKKAVPEFDAIDHDPKFHEYLNDVNEYGQIRMDLLRTAQSNQDVERIIKFYEDFKGLAGVQAAPTQRELQRVPPSIPDAPQAQPVGRVWDDSLVQKFYKDKVQGKFTPEESDFLEHEMQQYLLTHR